MEANEAMIEMAKRIGERNTGTFTVHPEHGVRQLDDETISLIRQTAINAALAAIMETQASLMSALEDERVEIDAANPNEIDVECNALVDRCLAAIRTGEHYALAGERHG